MKFEDALEIVADEPINLHNGSINLLDTPIAIYSQESAAEKIYMVLLGSKNEYLESHWLPEWNWNIIIPILEEHVKKNRDDL